MKQFFKIFLAALAAIVVFLFIGFIIIMGVAASGAAGGETEVLSKSIIHINASSAFSEQSKENPLAVLQGGSSHTNGLNKIIRALDNAKEDDRIKGIYIKMGICPNGWAGLSEFRDALIDFKTSGKFIYAYGEVADHKSYYLASVADKIFLNPHGGMEFKGLALVGNFMKGTLNKLGVKVEAFHCGQFKGAHEPFSRSDFSDPNEFQLKTMLTSIDSVFMSAVSKRTGKNLAELRTIANNMELKFPQDALELKFVDGLVYGDSVRALLKEKSGIDQDKDLRFVDIGGYAGTVSNMGSGDDKVAILYATGAIADGEGDDGIYSVNLTREIRKVAKDDDIKAVVLRVNSPGGSALASEIIYRELELLHKKKPIVVSMGDVAASGGYYIACAADKIYADANTITGSIGVVGMMFNIGDFMEDKLGVTFDAVKTSEFADFPNTYRDMTSVEKAFIQSSLDSVYITFKSRVAKARNLTLMEVEELAQGHVYSGTLAKSIKLVDEIGSKNDALEAVVKMAELDKYKIVEYPGQSDPFKDILKAATGGNRDVAFIKEYLGEDYKILEQLKQLRKQQNTIQALLPFNFDIK